MLYVQHDSKRVSCCVLLFEPLSQELLPSAHDSLRKCTSRQNQSNHKPLIDFRAYAVISFQMLLPFNTSLQLCFSNQTLGD